MLLALLQLSEFVWRCKSCFFPFSSVHVASGKAACWQVPLHCRDSCCLSVCEQQVGDGCACSIVQAGISQPSSTCLKASLASDWRGVSHADHCCLQDIALDGLVYWVPMLVHALIDGSMSLGLHTNSTGGGADTDKHCGGKDSQLQAVLLTAIPFGTAAVAALTLGHSSEVTGERCKHIGLPLLLGGSVFAALPWLLPLQSHVPAFLAVTAAVVAADATTGPFWVSVAV